MNRKETEDRQPGTGYDRYRRASFCGAAAYLRSYGECADAATTFEVGNA